MLAIEVENLHCIGSQLQQVAVDCERELNSLLELDQTRFAIKGR